MNYDNAVSIVENQEHSLFRIIVDNGNHLPLAACVASLSPTTVDLHHSDLVTWHTYWLTWRCAGHMTFISANSLSSVSAQSIAQTNMSISSSRPFRHSYPSTWLFLSITLYKQHTCLALPMKNSNISTLNSSSTREYSLERNGSSGTQSQK